MRCPDCNKFTSFGDPRIDQNDLTIDDDTVSIKVTITLECGYCGGELKSADIEASAEITHKCDIPASADEEWQFEAFGGFWFAFFGDFEGSGRYAKKFYGFSQTCQVKCVRCKELFHVSLKGEEQASSFNELV